MEEEEVVKRPRLQGQGRLPQGDRDVRALSGRSHRQSRGSPSRFAHACWPSLGPLVHRSAACLYAKEIEKLRDELAVAKAKLGSASDGGGGGKKRRKNVTEKNKKKDASELPLMADLAKSLKYYPWLDANMINQAIKPDGSIYDFGSPMKRPPSLPPIEDLKKLMNQLSRPSDNGARTRWRWRRTSVKRCGGHGPTLLRGGELRLTCPGREYTQFTRLFQYHVRKHTEWEDERLRRKWLGAVRFLRLSFSPSRTANGSR